MAFRKATPAEVVEIKKKLEEKRKAKGENK